MRKELTKELLKEVIRDMRSREQDEPTENVDVKEALEEIIPNNEPEDEVEELNERVERPDREMRPNVQLSVIEVMRKKAKNHAKDTTESMQYKLENLVEAAAGGLKNPFDKKKRK